MFALRLNELTVTLAIAPVSPLLVKAETRTDDEESPPPSDDAERVARPMTWVRGGGRLYLPGSSVRGVLRGAATRAVGRWHPQWALASDPFANATDAWLNDRRRTEACFDNADRYRLAGPIERCFGYTGLRGRWVFADAHWDQPPETALRTRHGVGISRTTGAAQPDFKFACELVTHGVFTTSLTLVNYELWQLGLLAHVLAMLDRGEARLGYGTRRGYGRVRVAATALHFTWFGKPFGSPVPAAASLPSLAGLARKAGVARGYQPRDAGLPRIAITPATGEFGAVYEQNPDTLPPEQADGFRPTDWLAEPWPAFGPLLPQALARWPFPDELLQFLAAAAQAPAP